MKKAPTLHKGICGETYKGFHMQRYTAQVDHILKLKGSSALQKYRRTGSEGPGNTATGSGGRQEEFERSLSKK